MASQQQRGPRPAPYCSKSPPEQPLQVKVVGLFKSSSFHIAKSAAETTVGPLSTFFSGEGAKCSSQLSSLFPSGHTYSDPLSKVIPSGHIYSDPLSKSLKSNYPTKFEDPIIVPLQEFAWDQYLQEKKRELKNEIWEYSSCVMCFVNDQFLGDAFDLQKWAHKMWDVVDFKPPALYEALTVDYSAKFLRDTKHGFVFLDISIDFHPIGRLVLELYYDACPKTCRNFQVLCTGKAGYSQRGIKLHYMGSIFHRIVQNGWIQGGDQSFDFTQTRFLTNSTKLNFRGLLGDIVAGKGDDGESIYGPTFEDENFSIPHDKRGVLGMVNKGRHSNGSQFYITLQPTPYLDRKYVAFGQLIEGTQVLRKLELVPTENERPKQRCMIVDSGDHYA